MKKTTEKMMAMLLSAAMMATPLMSAVPVYAQEGEFVELAGSLAEDSLTAVTEEPDGAVYESGDTPTDENASKGAGISKNAANVFKKMAGGKKSYMYKKLSKKEKKIYDKIDKEVKRLLYDGGATRKIKGDNSYRYTKEFYTEKFKTGGKQAETFMKVYYLYLLDNPQAIMLHTTTPHSTRKRTFYCYAQINDDTKTAKKIKDRAEEIARNISADAKIVNNEKGDYQKVFKIHEILCKRLEQGSDNLLYTIGGLHTTYYKNRTKANGWSYAIAFTALARLSGLEAYHVCGDRYDLNVEDWVRVKVNGKWYNVDPKKDDVLLEEDDFTRGYSLKYFLKNDKDLNCDNGHIVDKQYKKYYPKTCPTSYVLPVN